MAQSLIPSSAVSIETAVPGDSAVPPDGLFGTTTLAARLARFDDQWARAKQSARADPALQRLIAPARSMPREQQIAFVQSGVDQQIRWESDATEWGQHDYWASASETLAHGAGDMKNRTILKMQALLALGFSPDDLYLTLGRDPVGGPMALLAVRIAPGRYLTLDDLGGAPIPADKRESFQPVLSFSETGSWLHASRQVAVSQPAMATEAGQQ
ncbi:MAG TPA: transglutaminase-like cysteine peptidase [Sphingomicrobium sp.]|nr:transglutaminase-like cysteine peptidase [Sphingomicrobium sp.]